MTAGAQTFPAPEFPDGLSWLNVAAPLHLEALRGKVVLLDFWTYGCINCIHMIPVLEQLEDKYGDALVVIGVHSAKFENEGEIESLRQIVRRYDLRHPVIDDSDFVVWRQYGVRAWPTFVVIDPNGQIVAMQAGEIPFASFDRFIGALIEQHDSAGTIDRTPIELALEGAGQPSSVLAFPGKIAADTLGRRLFIADTNHHRIIIADLDTYRVLDVAGAGGSGFDDGSFETATFDKPHGMALVGDTLYVADTENHAIRAVDLLTRTVTTVAGTGEQSYQRDQGGAPLETALSSPWDVAFGDGVLFVAMAGPHQLWALLFERGVIGPVVGSGREGLLEGTFAEAQLAQPSGLVYHQRQLFFADSESSSIRAANLDARTTRTLAGPLVNDLFAFGDVDGAVGVSRLQHPLGVVLGDDGLLYVADTYNSKIKVLDLSTNTLTTLTGQGSPGGFRDGTLAEAQFDEPGGLAFAEGRLFVADTNNHAVRVVDLAAGTVSTLIFPNPEQLVIGDRLTVVSRGGPSETRLTLPAQRVAPGDGEIVLRIDLPEGYKINDLAPSRIEWNNAGSAIDIPEAERSLPVTETEVRLPIRLSVGSDALYGHLLLYYCQETVQTLCFIDQVALELPVDVTADAPSGALIIVRQIAPWTP